MLSSGCASNPPELPTWDFEPLDTDIAEAIPLGAMPMPTGNAAGELVLTLEQGQELELYQVRADSNTLLANDNAAAARELQKSHSELVVAGKSQREVAVLRQELLDQERADRRSDNLFHRVLIIGLVLALAL